MTIKLRHGAHVSGTEVKQAGAAGAQAVHIKHQIGQQNIDRDYHDIWSNRLSLTASIPVSLSVSSLTYPQRTEAKDLFTDQYVQLFAAKNLGQAIITVTLFNGADELERFVMSAEADLYASGSTGHLFAQPFDRVDLFALTGNTDIEILMASQLQ